MRCANSRAGLHRDHRFDRHRHVDQHPIALRDTARLERVGKATDAVIQLAIADAGQLAVIGLENDGDLVGLGVEMPVQAVVRSIGRAVMKPAKERCVRLIQRLGERLFPQQLLTRMTRPETFEIALGLIAQRLIGSHAGNIGLLHKRR